MRPYLTRNKILFVFFIMLSFIHTTLSCAESNSGLIKAKLVKDKQVLDVLVKETNRIAPSDSEIEENQIIEITYQNQSTYIVPIKSNAGDKRSCSMYSYDQKKLLRQKITLSELEEAESCEIIKAVFSCNRQDKLSKGVGVIYGKRLGSDNYWFEGTYLNIDNAGRLIEDKALSNRLNGADTVSKAKKKLGCR